MAHFAEIVNERVTRVIVVNNEVIGNAKGLKGEALGIAFCKSLYGDDTEWLQTSYNGNFRGKYAAAGDPYDPVTDTFGVPDIAIEETPAPQG